MTYKVQKNSYPLSKSGMWHTYRIYDRLCDARRYLNKARPTRYDSGSMDDWRIIDENGKDVTR